MEHDNAGHDNIVMLRGTVSSDPVRRELPSGEVVTLVDVTTVADGRSVSAPVAVHGREVAVVAGDPVVVTGFVRRRFFRAGGRTQSRTEVIATDLIPARRVRTAQRAVDRLVERLVEAGSPR